MEKIKRDGAHVYPVEGGRIPRGKLERIKAMEQGQIEICLHCPRPECTYNDIHGCPELKQYEKEWKETHKNDPKKPKRKRVPKQSGDK